MTDDPKPTAAEALLPCPFCDSDRVTVWNFRDGQQAVCKDCHATGAPSYHGPADKPSSHDRARAAWNTRAATPQPEPPAEVERVWSQPASQGVVEHAAEALWDVYRASPVNTSETVRSSTWADLVAAAESSDACRDQVELGRAEALAVIRVLSISADTVTLPREPTDAMLDAFCKAEVPENATDDWRDDIRASYRAMIAVGERV